MRHHSCIESSASLSSPLMGDTICPISPGLVRSFTRHNFCLFVILVGFCGYQPRAYSRGISRSFRAHHPCCYFGFLEQIAAEKCRADFGGRVLIMARVVSRSVFLYKKSGNLAIITCILLQSVGHTVTL